MTSSWPWGRSIASIALATLAFAAHAAGPRQDTLPIQPISIGIQLIQAEVASTPMQREIGLMNRRSLPPNGGMLFVFDEKNTECMWMRNTLIALSVAFINDDGTIANIEEMKPQTDDTHCAVVPVRYALEMNAAWFSKRGIKPGARVSGIPASRAP